jgi:hypothetical protein
LICWVLHDKGIPQPADLSWARSKAGRNGLCRKQKAMGVVKKNHVVIKMKIKY